MPKILSRKQASRWTWKKQALGSGPFSPHFLHCFPPFSSFLFLLSPQCEAHIMVLAFIRIVELIELKKMLRLRVVWKTSSRSIDYTSVNFSHNQQFLADFFLHMGFFKQLLLVYMKLSLTEFLVSYFTI